MEKPAGSEIQVEERPDGMTITVPASGMWRNREAKALFLVGIALAAFMLFCTIVVIQKNLAGKPPVYRRTTTPVPVVYQVGGLAFFWVIGIGQLVRAWNVAKRRVIIDVVGVPGRTLVVTQESIFGVKQKEWERAAIERIEVGPSRMKILGTAAPQLQVRAAKQRAFGLLAGRDKAELERMAGKVRAAMGVPFKS